MHKPIALARLTAFSILAAMLVSGCETTDSSKPAPTTQPPPVANTPTPPAARSTPSTKVSATPPPVVVAGAPGHYVEKYTATDGRQISIGRSTPGNGGTNFKEPHMNKCWIADGFNFSGFDTLYIAPTQSTAKFHDDEAAPHELAKENLVGEFDRSFAASRLFRRVVTNATAIRAGSHSLKMENTIIQYAKGGGAARYFVGMYGGGQPVLVVQGKITENGKTVFTYEAKRSGTSANARMGGAFMKDTDIQTEDIRSMALDLTDFMQAVAGKYAEFRQ